MRDAIREAIDIGEISLKGIRMGMTNFRTDDSIKILAVKYRRELFHLHQELGKILGVLDQEQEDAT